MQDELFDLILRGGTLIDGTGAPRHRGDLGIRDGRIAALGEVRGPSLREIDVTGCVVAPGFVDVYTYYDAQVLWDPRLEAASSHGITTAILGASGLGLAPTRARDRGAMLRTLATSQGLLPCVLEAGLDSDWGFESFAEYASRVEARGLGINVAALVGHTPLRLRAMGDDAFERAATEEELLQMEEGLMESLQAGALGFATSRPWMHSGEGRRQLPSHAAPVEEVYRLAAAMSHAGRGTIQVTGGRGLFLNELEALARKTGRPVCWTALVADACNPGAHRERLARFAELQRQGLAIVPQVSCRAIHLEFQFAEPYLFERLPSFRQVLATQRSDRARLYADPAFREQVKREHGVAPLWSDLIVNRCASRPELEERSVLEVASACGQHPVDLALDLALETDLEARFRLAVFNTDEAAVSELLAHPGVMLGASGSGGHLHQPCGTSFPAHLLGHWVRERKALSLEEGVRLLSSRSAELLGISDRGRLAPGLAADVVAFDPQTVGSGPLRRVADLPGGFGSLVRDARGFRCVVVNGEVAHEAGRSSLAQGELPGRFLRGGAA